jgi:hypothetical protein
MATLDKELIIPNIIITIRDTIYFFVSFVIHKILDEILLIMLFIMPSCS